jgi:staphylococcal nuclease domain-containing protein 1
MSVGINPSALPPVTYGRVAQDIGSSDFPLARKPKKAKAPTPAPAKAAPAPVKRAAPPASSKPKAPKKEKKKAAAAVDEDEEEPIEHKPSEPREPKASGYGIVKEVQSGDSLVVVGAAVDGSGLLPERNITLSGILAPKLGRGRAGAGAQDAPFAWAAREFLRQRLVGQQIYFVINHKDETTSREFANVTFQGEDLATLLLKSGLVSVKPAKDGKAPPERKALLDIEAAAKAAGAGQWTSDRSIATTQVRIVNWEPDARALFEKHRGFPLPAIVDQVRDGSTLRCELLGERGVLSHVMITLYLAGLRAPNVPLSEDFIKRQRENKKKAGNDDEDDERPISNTKAEPLAKEAQQFTEMRLLNREVDVILQGIDAFGHFFGTVRFHRGNISLKLLEKGFAKVVAWSARLTGEADKYISAQSQAKAAKAGIWEDYEGGDEKEDNIEGKAVSVRVVEVSSGDTIKVVDEKGNETRHPFASIRAPRMGNARRDEPAQPWGWEAREYVRRSLIGRTVQMIEEYTRELRPNTGEVKRGKKAAPAPAAEIQRYVTVIYNKENISEQLVLRGLANVIRHRPEEPRAIDYDLLQSAEAKATEAKKGQHGKTTFQRVTDLSSRGGDDRKTTSGSRASSYLNDLKNSEFEAVVEYVFSGSRLKLYVPSHGILVSFVLGGIQTKAPKDDAFPIGDNAASFTKELVFQQTVRVTVDSLDKGDSFIGAISIGDVSLGVRLLQEGLATVYRSGPADQARASYTGPYDAAEQQAKDAKRGWWVDHVAGSDDGIAAASGEGKMYTVQVTEIKDAATFYVHVKGDPNVEDVEAKVKAFNEDVKDAPEDFKVSAGDIVAAKWGVEGQEPSYYRVKIERVIGNDKYRVFFIDYGNSDVVTLDTLRPLTEGLAELPAIARSCQLAGVMAPFQHSEYSEQASYAFNDLAMGKELLARVEVVRDDQWLVTLNTESTPVSINAQLVSEGWVKLQKRPPRKLIEYVRGMISYKEDAKKYRRGQFENGSFSDEEEDDDDFPPRRGGAPQQGGRRRGVGGGKGSDRATNVIATKPESKTAAPAKGAAPAATATSAKKDGKKDAAPAKAAAKTAAPAKVAAAAPAAAAKKGKGK